jgi:phage-related protein
MNYTKGSLVTVVSAGSKYTKESLVGLNGIFLEEKPSNSGIRVAIVQFGDNFDQVAVSDLDFTESPYHVHVD